MRVSEACAGARTAKEAGAQLLRSRFHGGPATGLRPDARHRRNAIGRWRTREVQHIVAANRRSPGAIAARVAHTRRRLPVSPAAAPDRGAARSRRPGWQGPCADARRRQRGDGRSAAGRLPPPCGRAWAAVILSRCRRGTLGCLIPRPTISLRYYSSHSSRNEPRWRGAA